MRYLIFFVGILVAILGIFQMSQGSQASIFQGNALLIIGAILFAAGSATIDIVAALDRRR